MSKKAAKFMAQETAKMVRSMVKSSVDLDQEETAMEEFVRKIASENDEDNRNALLLLFTKATKELESGPRRSEKSRRKRTRKHHKNVDESKSGMTEQAEVTQTSNEVEQANPEQAPEQEQASQEANILDSHINCEQGICSPLDSSAKPNSKNSCIDVMIAAGKYNSDMIINTVGCSKDTYRKRLSKLSKMMNHSIAISDDGTVKLLVGENA